MTPPAKWVLSSHHKERYASWAGNRAGVKPDPNRCCKEVWARDRSMMHHQCRKPRGFGPEQAYCRQHDPEAVKAREDADTAKWRAKHEASLREQRMAANAEKFFAALCQIADGHNDPRSLARDVIAGIPRTDQ